MAAARVCVPFVALAAIASARARHPVVVEGPIDAIRAAGSATVLTVMGTELWLDTATEVRMPTASIPHAQLIFTAPLPGRAQPGFVGATADAHGAYDVASAKIVVSEAFVEPAENVMAAT